MAIVETFRISRRSGDGVPAWGVLTRRLRRQPSLVAGLAIMAVILLVAVAPGLLTDLSPTDVDVNAAMQGPSAEHWFGTDETGRDIYARTLYGTRVTLSVVTASLLISATLGGLLGLAAGFFGGWTDTLLSRLIEVFLSVPQLPLLLVVVYLYRSLLVGTFGPQLGVFMMIVGVIGGLNWMATARLVRAGFIQQREREYVEAARCLGAGPWRLIRQILPNTLSPIIVAGTLSVGSSMIAESTLSFLGLGFPPDTPTWGRLLFDALNFLTIQPSLALIPGLMIFLAVLSINFIGDGLRDALDPRRTL